MRICGFADLIVNTLILILTLTLTLVSLFSHSDPQFQTDLHPRSAVLCYARVKTFGMRLWLVAANYLHFLRHPVGYST